MDISRFRSNLYLALASAPRSLALPKRFYRWRVPCGHMLGFLTLVLAEATPESLLWGAALALPGQLMRLWASGHLEKKNRQLATGGPYRHTQHPLYLGSSILALGVAVASGSFVIPVLIAAYLVAFYPYVVRDEVDFLRETFGEEHAEWSAAVPSFLPRLSPAGPSATRFCWRRVLANGEWKACFALPLALALFHLRNFLP